MIVGKYSEKHSYKNKRLLNRNSSRKHSRGRAENTENYPKKILPSSQGNTEQKKPLRKYLIFTITTRYLSFRRIVNTLFTVKVWELEAVGCRPSSGVATSPTTHIQNTGTLAWSSSSPFSRFYWHLHRYSVTLHCWSSSKGWTCITSCVQTLTRRPPIVPCLPRLIMIYAR